MFWRTDSYKRIHANDERWIDSLGFSYGEDSLLSYKAAANGMKVGIDFGIDITNLDSRTDSNRYHNDPQRFYIRTKAIFITWWRMCYKPHGNNNRGSIKALLAGTFKFLWLLPVMLVTSAVTQSVKPFTFYLRGLRDGYHYVHSTEYTSLPPYIINPLNE